MNEHDASTSSRYVDEVRSARRPRPTTSARSSPRTWRPTSPSWSTSGEPESLPATRGVRRRAAGRRRARRRGPAGSGVSGRSAAMTDSIDAAHDPRWDRLLDALPARRAAGVPRPRCSRSGGWPARGWPGWSRRTLRAPTIVSTATRPGSSCSLSSCVVQRPARPPLAGASTACCGARCSCGCCSSALNVARRGGAAGRRRPHGERRSRGSRRDLLGRALVRVGRAARRDSRPRPAARRARPAPGGGRPRRAAGRAS